MLITLQNLSSAIMTSLSETVGAAVANQHLHVASVPADVALAEAALSEGSSASDVTLATLHAIWWFNFAGGMAALLLAVFMLRIPKAEEKEHLQ